MGWSSGTDLMVEIAEAYESLHADEDSETKIAFYEKVIETMTDHDWDNLDEVVGISRELDHVLAQQGVDLNDPM